MHKYLVPAFMLLGGTAAATFNFVSAYYYPHWTIYYRRSKIPVSVRGKIEMGRYAAYWTLMLVLLVAWGPLFYLSLPGFFYMLWRCGRAYNEDKRPFESSKSREG